MCNFAEKFFVLMLDARGAGIRHTFKLVSAMQLVCPLNVVNCACVIMFYRFSFMYAKYFAVYFCCTIKFDARVANLILYYIYIVMLM